MLIPFSQNPGKFTLQGTNTYLIHVSPSSPFPSCTLRTKAFQNSLFLQHPTSPSLILLDTAQDVPSYLPHLREALLSHPIQPCYVSDIVLSHWHMDHVDGLRTVLEGLGEWGFAGTGGTRVWKYRCEGEDEVGKDREIEQMLDGIREGLVRIEGDRERLVEGGKIGAMREGQKLVIEGEGDEVELEVVSTPGHTTDSISLLLRSSSSSSKLSLFSFDTVLGHGTAVFSSLATYLNSLSNLISRLPENEKTPIYPGHGEVIEDGVGKLKEYRKHRLDREEQVVEALKGLKGGVTASQYGLNFPPLLIGA